MEGTNMTIAEMARTTGALIHSITERILGAERILGLDPIGGHSGPGIFNNDEFADDIGECLHGGVVDDAKIKPETGVADIKRIPLVAPENLLEGLGRATISFYLGQACDTRFHHTAKFVGIDYAGKARAILIHMGSGADDAHMAGQDV